MEDADHIFFNCPLAQFAWSSIRQLFNVNWNPSSFANLFPSFRGLGGAQMVPVDAICSIELRALDH
jgi:hypothetical protein